MPTAVEIADLFIKNKNGVLSYELTPSDIELMAEALSDAGLWISLYIEQFKSNPECECCSDGWFALERLCKWANEFGRPND